MENKPIIHIGGDYDGKPIILHLLEGAAPLPINRLPTKIEGDVDAISNYLQFVKQGQQIGLERCHICVAEQMRMAVLYIDPHLPHFIQVTAKIQFSEAFNRFGIEQGQRYTVSTLMNRLRVSKHFFPDPEKYSDLLLKLQRFSAKASQEFTDENDQRGNSTAAKVTRLQTDLPESFELDLSIVKGDDKVKMRVEICMEATASGIALWLESPEAMEYIDRRLESFKQRIGKIGTDYNIPVIYS